MDLFVIPLFFLNSYLPLIMNDPDEIKTPVILFDGVCNLCNGVVQFIIKQDRKKVFWFASLQSGFGQKVLKKFCLSGDSFDSFILFDKNKMYTKSTAALMVARQLPGGWKLLLVFIIVPPLIRNAVYDFIAKNRYNWFGKRASCLIPSPALQSRFLDE